MEPTGEVAGSPYHVLDDSALRSSFERWRDDSVQHGLSIEVKDAGETSMKTVMHAIDRVEALMPPEVRERVTFSAFVIIHNSMSVTFSAFPMSVTFSAFHLFRVPPFPRSFTFPRFPIGSLNSPLPSPCNAQSRGIS
jgi:hypothetical protein